MIRRDILATYRVRATAAVIEARAHAIAVEQSVEMPLDAIVDGGLRDLMAGQLESIEDAGGGSFRVRIALNAATAGIDAGQLMNMLFGNSSIHDDLTLEDAELPDDLVAAYQGPSAGIEGIRDALDARGRALTCAALKPQGLPPDGHADLAYRLALGGIGLIKDDHSLAEQVYSPFEARVAAVAAAVRRANAETGKRTIYAPNISGNLDDLRRQIRVAEDQGVRMILISPMISGLPQLQAVRREFPHMMIMAHPAMAGASKIAPPLLIGKLFRMIGADALVYPNYGGRFGYSPETCRALAGAARQTWLGIKPALPAPAGGMTLDRIPEILDFYGRDTIVLIGGNLLAARDRLTEATAAFAARVADHAYKDA